MSFNSNDLYSKQKLSSNSSLSNDSNNCFDFEGLEESLVDNELNEDLNENHFFINDTNNHFIINDVINADDSVVDDSYSFHALRESLIRDSLNRDENDLQLIQTFVETICEKQNHLKDKQTVLNQLNNSAKRVLCKHFVLAEIETKNTRILTNGEKLDAFCLIAFGELRHRQAFGENAGEFRDKVLRVGHELGAKVSERVICGEVFTWSAFVWVLCVPHLVFDQLLNEHNDRDDSLCESEDNRTSLLVIRDDICGDICEVRERETQELIRCSEKRLNDLLFENIYQKSVENDDEFISDFLLTFRLWAKRVNNKSRDERQNETEEECLSSNDSDVNHVIRELMRKIIKNLREERNVEKNIKIVLFWISNHFQDFQHENRHLLQEFESSLNSKIHKKLFYMSLSLKSRERTVVLTRSDRKSALPFTLIGGYECSCRLFVSDVKTTPDDSVDCQTTGVLTTTTVDVVSGDDVLKRGDRLLSINGIDCHVMQLSRALELCKSSTHLSVCVKFDPNMFQLLLDGQISRNSESKRLLNEMKPQMTSTLNSSPKSVVNNNSNNNWRQKVFKMFETVTQNKVISATTPTTTSSSSGRPESVSSVLDNDRTSLLFSSSPLLQPEVIKVYFDSDFRFLPIMATTTARECIQLALIEFQMNNQFSSRDFALFEHKLLEKKSLTSSVKRFSDFSQNLAKNLSQNSRIYLKNISKQNINTNNVSKELTETEITKEIAREVRAEEHVLALDCCEIARELTERDFNIFCLIESQEFICDLFERKVSEKYYKNMKEFERKTNSEMFWTINQLLFEKNDKKRQKVFKKILRICEKLLELKNFNSFFSLLSGLNHLSVKRITNLWEKLPQKTLKLLEKLSELMNPSKNFQTIREIYRKSEKPFIPFFPLCKKDLIFIFLANQTFVTTVDDDCDRRQTEPSSVDVNDDRTTAAMERRVKDVQLINWQKMRLLSEKIREIQRMTDCCSQTTQHMSNTTTGRSEMTSYQSYSDLYSTNQNCSFNYKKIWEKQRMKKRVQTFLDTSFAQIISDENVLIKKSLECFTHTDSNKLMTSSLTTRSSLTSTGSLASHSSSASVTSQLSQHSRQSSDCSSGQTCAQLCESGHVMCDDVMQRRLRFGVKDDNGLKKLLALSDNCVNIGSHGNQTVNQSIVHFLNNNSLPKELSVSSVVIGQHNHTHNYQRGQSLPKESSSVTSLRRLEQLQQLSRFRDQLSSGGGLTARPVLPSYDQTIERLQRTKRVRSRSDREVKENIV